MKPYKLKHVPSGLYYQPHKHHGSNISKRGKIYQTGTHGLSSAFKHAEKYKNLYPNELNYQKFRIQVEKDSLVHKHLKDMFTWVECKWAYNQLMADTLISDWVIEEI